MPKPKKSEEKDDYISRCVKYLMEKEDKEQQQALAICYNYWNKYHNENSEFINIDDYVDLMTETTKINDTYLMEALIRHEKSVFQKPSPAKLLSYDQPSMTNKIQKIKGILINDTVNHPIFPLYTTLIDTSKFWLPKIKNEYQAIFTGMETLFMPWHFTIEMIENNYYIFNTRPLDMAFPLRSKECFDLIDENNIELTNDTKKFFDIMPFDTRDAIHICIIGDSQRDVYSKQFYEILGRVCVGPIGRHFNLPLKVYQRIWPFNLQSKFKMNLLDSNIRI